MVLVVEAGKGLGDDEKSAIAGEGASMVEELGGELAIAMKEEPDLIERSVESAEGEVARGAGNAQVVALGLHRPGILPRWPGGRALSLCADCQ
jgi:hypothetical protein